MSSEDLPPCPFCRGTNLMTRQIEHDEPVVQCLDCAGCGPLSGWKKTANPPPIVKRLEWKQHGGATWVAESALGGFFVQTNPNVPGWGWGIGDAFREAQLQNPQVAMQHAQDFKDKVVTGCLIPPADEGMRIAMHMAQALEICNIATAANGTSFEKDSLLKVRQVSFEALMAWQNLPREFYTQGENV